MILPVRQSLVTDLWVMFRVSLTNIAALIRYERRALSRRKTLLRGLF